MSHSGVQEGNLLDLGGLVVFSDFGCGGEGLGKVRERATFFLSGAVADAGADSLFVDVMPDGLRLGWCDLVMLDVPIIILFAR